MTDPVREMIPVFDTEACPDWSPGPGEWWHQEMSLVEIVNLQGEGGIIILLTPNSFRAWKSPL